MFDSIYEIWGAILRNKMRTLATGVAVASGLFLLIVLQGAGNGVIHTFENNQGGISLNAVHLWGGWTNMPYEGMSEGRRIALDTRAVDAIRRRFQKEVIDICPISNGWGVTVNYGEEFIIDVQMQGVMPNYLKMSAVNILRGRSLHQVDLDEQRKVALLSDKREKELSPRGKSLLGERLLVNGQYFLVVGIYEDKANDDRSTIYAPFTTIQSMYGQGRFVGEICMECRDLSGEAEAKKFDEDMHETLGRIYSFDPADKRAIWLWNEARSNAELAQGTSMLHTGFWVLGLLTLVSGIAGVGNIMLIAVKERTREFGIRKALGARPWSILRMVILESVLITSFFGYIGMLCGLAFCEYMDKSVANRSMNFGPGTMTYFLDPTVEVSTCLWATFVLVVAGTLAGFIPAYKASHVKPVIALQG